MRIECSEHSPAARLTHDSGKLGERVRPAIAHASRRATDRIACDHAALSVDLRIDEVVMITPVSAVRDTTERALDRIVRSSVGDKPRVAAIVSRGDVEIPDTGKVHALIVSETTVVN